MPSSCSSESRTPVRADGRLSGPDGVDPGLGAEPEGWAAAGVAGRDGADPACGWAAGRAPEGAAGAVGPFAPVGPFEPAGAPAGRAALAASPAAIVFAVAWSTSS